MIALWMLSACAFALAVAAVAFGVDRTLRVFRVQTRVVWIAALVLATLWPVLAPTVLGLTSRPLAGALFTTTSVQTVGTGASPELAPTLRDRLTALDRYLLAAWFAATSVLFVRAIRTAAALQRVRRHSTRQEIGGRTVLGSRNLGPAVFGILRPEIILPAWAFDLDERDSDLVLRHEECHIHAADPALMTISYTMVALTPWNIPLWFIAQQLRLAIEVDCDIRVLQSGADAKRYAQLLLLTAQQQRHTTMTPSIAGFPSMLKERINVMHSDPHARPRFSRAIRLGALAVLVIGGTFAATSPLLARELGAVRVSDALQTMNFARRSLPQPPMREFKVDTQTTIAANSPLPRYPDELSASKVSGNARVQFVVDTMGRADPLTLKVIQTSHSPFSESVRSALPFMRFVSARVADRKVKQLVQVNFQFDVSGKAETVIAPPTNNIRTINVMISGR